MFHWSFPFPFKKKNFTVYYERITTPFKITNIPTTEIKVKQSRESIEIKFPVINIGFLQMTAIVGIRKKNST